MSPMMPLRKFMAFVLLAVLIPALAQAVVSIGRYLDERRTEPPVRAAREFLAVLREKDCDRIWSYFSVAAQRRIGELSQQLILGDPYGTERYAPRQLYCRPSRLNPFWNYEANTARLRSHTPPRAVVSIDHREADPKSFLIPGFWPTRYIVTAAEMRMLFENGAWRIDLS